MREILPFLAEALPDTTAGKLKSVLVDHFDCVHPVRKAWEAKRGWLGNAVFRAAVIDMRQGAFKPFRREGGDIAMVLRVIADLKAHGVQLLNLLPRRVIRFAFEEAQAFGHEKGSAKAKIFHNLRDQVAIRFIGVVKGEHNEFVGNG